MTPNIAIASISRLVAIGRRMNGSEMFTELRPRGVSVSGSAAAIASAVPASAASAAARRRVEVRRHARSGLEPELSLGDDRLARLQALVDHDVLIDALRRRDGTLLDGRI